MLVLSRKKGDAVVIDGGIKITVLEVRGNVVRLGIEAPEEISVRRSELSENGNDTSCQTAPPTVGASSQACLAASWRRAKENAKVACRASRSD
jgi:carbon storage regulator